MTPLLRMAGALQRAAVLALTMAANGAMLAHAPVAAAAVGTAERYPNRPIRLVNPFAPGGVTDVTVQHLTPHIVNAWGQQIVIDNRPGAGTNIGTEIVVRAPPDGYTLLATTTSIATNPSFYPRLPFTATRDLAPVALLAETPGALAVHMGLPAKTLPELIALARAQPGQITLASAGTGTSTHLAIELLKSMAKIDVVHVPFKGGGGGIVGVMGGQLSGVMTVLTLVQSHHNTGKVRIVAVTTQKRSPLANDIPTFAEAGLPGYEAAAWVGLFAPRGTALPVIHKWNAEINRVIRDADLKERFRLAGLTVPGGSEREFSAFFMKETERWAALIKTANISISP